MSYSIESSGVDCYPNTTVLINKLNIHDQKNLSMVESVIVTLKSAKIESKDDFSPLTFEYYCGLHRQLFGDLYEWAGEIRSIDFSKMETQFYPAKEIRSLGDAKFRRLADMNEFRGLSREKLVDEITDLYHELNMLHPFREGNGRTQRLFFTTLMHRLDYHISFAECDTDELMVATIYAAKGMKTYLHDFFNKMLK